MTSGKALFIADLHLDPRNQACMTLALQFLRQARGSSSLFILGDLFEYWIGDDVGIDAYQPVISALKKLADQDCAITVMHGNRDFLLGQQFANACHARLLTEDELLIELDGQAVLLMHGDTLCSDDTEYQQFRTLVRSEQWQSEFLALSASDRVTRANALRESSKSASQSKQQSIMDVNAQQVLDRMTSTQCQVLIHGHTHRPCVHSLSAIGGTRYVLGDWHADHAKVLKYEGGHFTLHEYTA